MAVRETVRRLLIGDAPYTTYPWGDRAVEIQSLRAGLDPGPPPERLPFLIVKKGPQDAGEIWGDVADTVEVWPYSSNGDSLQTLDSYCWTVHGLLTNKLVTDEDGASYVLEYSGSPTQDTPAEQWDAYTRPLRFLAIRLRWRGQTHPLVTKLREWTAAMWPVLQTDPDAWTPSDAAPGVYWRLSQAPTIRDFSLCGQWQDVLTGTLVAHVVAPSPAVRELWTATLSAALARASIALGGDPMPRTSYVLGTNVTRSDPHAAQHTDGQVTVEITYAQMLAAYGAAFSTAPATVTLTDGVMGGDVTNP